MGAESWCRGTHGTVAPSIFGLATGGFFIEIEAKTRRFPPFCHRKRVRTGPKRSFRGVKAPFWTRNGRETACGSA